MMKHRRVRKEAAYVGRKQLKPLCEWYARPACAEDVREGGNCFVCLLMWGISKMTVYMYTTC